MSSTGSRHHAHAPSAHSSLLVRGSRWLPGRPRGLGSAAGPLLFVVIGVVPIGMLSGLAWQVSGAPWWQTVVVVGTALVTRRVGRLLPTGLRWIWLAGVLAGAVALADATSLVAGLLVGAGVMIGWLSRNVHRGSRSHSNRGRGGVIGRDSIRLDASTDGGVHGRSRARVMSTSGARRQPLMLVAVLLMVGGLVGVAAGHLHARQARLVQTAQDAAVHRAQLLPSSPARAARLLLRAIAERDTAMCTTLLNTTAARDFAIATGTSDCPAAIRALHARVVDPRRYPKPDSRAITTALSPDAQAAAADLCHLGWDGVAGILDGRQRTALAPGPQIGTLRMDRVLGQGYQITSYLPCW